MAAAGRAGAFAPALGKDAYDRFIGFKLLDNTPNNHGDHLGSAYQGGTYGLMQKDLRTLLGRKRLQAGLRGHRPGQAGRYSRTYCGGTKRRRARCGAAAALLRAHPERGPRQDARQLYGDDEICNAPSPASARIGPGPQAAPTRRASTAIWMRALGAARAAGHPLDQPPDLPAGRGDPEPKARASGAR